MLNEYDDNYYEIMESNLDFFESKIVKNIDATWINKKIESSDKIVWVFSDDSTDLIKRFTGDPERDISNAFNLYFNKDISECNIILIISSYEMLEKTMPSSVKNLPFISLTHNDKVEVGFALDDIDFFNI